MRLLVMKDQIMYFEKVYGNDNLDWVILMSNNIIDINNEWNLHNSN